MVSTFFGRHLRPRRGGLVPLLLGALAMPLLAAPPALAQAASQGAAFVAGSQQPDGGWTSGGVRFQHVTAEALRALVAAAQQPAARDAAADFLSLEPVADSDDAARRMAALLAAGRDVSALQAALAAAADPRGGWGLTASFSADPLDTALALEALAGPVPPGDELLRRGLAHLLSRQRDDGGFPCVDSPQAGSEIYCTAQALLALVRFRTTFFLDPEIDATVGFLRARLNADGSFGPAGADQLLHTAVAATALATVPAFGPEVAAVNAWIEGRQLADGSWQGDAYPTALALRALAVLSTVPYCGDALINRPGEACDGPDLGGLTCEGIGLGAGTLACSAQCTLDTSGCSAPPICGDDLRNQPFEVCDGSDLAAQSCESLGFASGTLACAADCTSFDVGGCNAEATCGDGVVNLPGELCDLNDLNGQTCESLGLGAGLLQCAPDCNLDTSLCDAAGFEIDNKGREFFVGYLLNFDTLATAALHLASDTATTATVQYPAVGPTFVRTVALTPGQVSIVNLPQAAYTAWTAGTVRANAVRVSAPEELVVYLVNRRPFSSDAGMALPVDALGTSHIVTTYVGSFVNSADRAQFLVVAPFDDTMVTITPATQLRSGGTALPAGVPFQLTLDRGEGYRGEAFFFRTDLTGTLVESSRPVFVMNGNTCTNVPTTTAFCDHVFEVAHPVRSWGLSALVANLPNRPAGSFYRVVAAEDGTEVLLDGVPQAILGRGGFVEVGPLPGSHVFSAAKPIFVTQFMSGSTSPGGFRGDPAMANMIPAEQYLESYIFSTVGGGQFIQHFLTVIAPDDALGEVLLDGTPVSPGAFTPIGASGFSSALLPLAEGTHATSSPQPHGITVEGINQDDSYVYPGGARLEFINQFCGDGEVNLANEQCDGSDFEGASCSTFGFSAGFLQCTTDCRTDTSQCSGISSEDDDDDGFPAGEDCDDGDPEVNPGMDEILGNGVDDDCNPGTPDDVPPGALSCRLLSDLLLYQATAVVGLDGSVDNGHATFTFTGLEARLVVRDGGGTSVHEESRSLAPLPPGGRALQRFSLSALGRPAGEYRAELTVSAAGTPRAQCSVLFAIEDSAASGAGLEGSLGLDPARVDAGDPTVATWTVRNLGNAALDDLALRVVLVEPQTGEVLGELTESVSLVAGASHTGSGSFATAGLDTNRTYPAILLATPAGGVELTLDRALLTVVNAPPDCAAAAADQAVLWPPNHKLVEVAVTGVTDPDGDPVSVVVTGVHQDERTDDLGSGDTCPDAAGVGTSSASLRAERSGRQDGRTYHLHFEADDGRGGTCQGEVLVCVPHSAGGTCVDQGPLHDSTVCD